LRSFGQIESCCHAASLRHLFFSLGPGPHPRRELTPMLRLGFTCPRLSNGRRRSPPALPAFLPFPPPPPFLPFRPFLPLQPFPPLHRKVIGTVPTECSHASCNSAL